MTDEQRAKIEQMIMTAFGLMRMQGPPPTDEELTDGALAERKQMVASLLDKVVDELGMRQAFQHVDHPMVCRVFREGYKIGRLGGPLTGAGLKSSIAVLMTATNGRANPAEIERILTNRRLEGE